MAKSIKKLRKKRSKKLRSSFSSKLKNRRQSGGDGPPAVPKGGYVNMSLLNILKELKNRTHKMEQVLRKNTAGEMTVQELISQKGGGRRIQRGGVTEGFWNILANNLVRIKDLYVALLAATNVEPSESIQNSNEIWIIGIIFSFWMFLVEAAPETFNTRQ